ncbi:MAG: DUF6443 domain-containing protein [Cytophagales bacterium]|nr:DUF6443 domain-containing protein [Cytophagales bacterium]
MNLKVILLLLATLTSSVVSLGQTSTKNYVMSLTARDTIKTNLNAQRANQQQVQTDIVYVDGLGRTSQEVMREASPNGSDMVKMYSYDPIGRADKDYLPFRANTTSGAYYNSPLTGLEGFYDAPPTGVDTIDYPYSQTLFDDSPLNRAIETSSPGTPWRSSAEGGTHAVSYTYQFNEANEIRQITVDNSANQIMTATGNYPANELRGMLTTDEDGKMMLEYTNKTGQVVCKINAVGTTDETYTYYVFDDYNLLTFVIPPQAVAEIGTNWSLLNDNNFRSKWLFRYQYDNRNRMIEKQVPGAEKIEMVYDKRDRLVFTLDGNRRNVPVISGTTTSGSVQYVESGTLVVESYQGKNYVRAPGAKILFKKPNFSASKADNFSATKSTSQATYEHQWLYTKYDELNRPVMTGIKSMTQNRSELQAIIDGNNNYDFGVAYIGNVSGNVHGYDDTSYPQASGTEVLTVTYYDKYDFITDFSWRSDYSYANHYPSVKGLVTGGLTKLLKESPVKHLKSVAYYDDRLRSKATITENYFGDADQVVITYRNKVSPLVKRSSTLHRNGTSTTTIEENFTYDHRDRLLIHTHEIVGHGTKPLASHTYNAIGQLIEKDLHDDGSPAQSVDYRYNERGWLTTINGGANDFDDPSTDQFGMELKYNDASSGNFNGNISQMLWKAKGGGVTEATQNYQYSYDNLNRLKLANYTGVGNYDVSGITYDKNGNLQTLQRNTIDNLGYDYIGNQLTRVEDATNNTQGFMNVSSSVGTEEYKYDKNGNMTSDSNKGITNIQYNYLNLPQRVTMNTGQSINYTYDATGVKHLKTFNGKEWTYDGVFHYEKEPSEGSAQLEFILHAEGRALRNQSSWNYHYNVADHLGNIRVTVSENGSVMQRDAYYPFGSTFNHSALSPENLYKLTGNEEQKEWRVFDFNARMFDSWLGRFNSIDPLADTKQESWNPYHFNYNNPIAYVDPTGLFSTHTDSTGNVIAVYDDGDLGVYRHDDATTKEDVDQKRADSETTSGDGKKMGETEYWDDFVYESTGDVVNEYGVGFRIMFGESWDSQINSLANQAQGMDVIQIAMESRNNGVFSIQDQQPGVGKMLNGKYISSKSAGNYLAGLNASMHHLDFDTFQRLAGALHSLNHSNPPKELTVGRMLHVYFGGSYGPAPVYGETLQQYRWSKRGYDAGVSYRRFAPRGVR